jgi:hypothetical protein
MAFVKTVDLRLIALVAVILYHHNSRSNNKKKNNNQNKNPSSHLHPRPRRQTILARFVKTNYAVITR